MILTTTNTIEGFKIIEYKGIITGTSFEMKTKFSFKTEKNKDITKDVINEAKEHAFQELQTNASNLNANAVVGISVDMETVNGSYFFVSVTGTAVSVASDK
ncbi:YbjQ family protein [Olleya aquimaris]|uniref:Heavy metal-binding domain-containing protein n=1 Tax=Olleya sediminilitoris TaxID=2795739 RepID=A0ABS1WH69_9FLAO|nr:MULTISPECIES: heavy metal-binding domain-containing protein [Olleya]AXO80743.1 YbjQ family protein [Olleya aquimaris]MBL7558471.1 heavy metal-binding domain-containing protein [Olleya sediminilitoris]